MNDQINWIKNKKTCKYKMNVSNNIGTSLNLNILFKFICLNMDDN